MFSKVQDFTFPKGEKSCYNTVICSPSFSIHALKTRILLENMDLQANFLPDVFSQFLRHILNEVWAYFVLRNFVALLFYLLGNVYNILFSLFLFEDNQIVLVIWKMVPSLQFR